MISITRTTTVALALAGALGVGAGCGGASSSSSDSARGGGASGGAAGARSSGGSGATGDGGNSGSAAGGARAGSGGSGADANGGGSGNGGSESSGAGGVGDGGDSASGGIAGSGGESSGGKSSGGASSGGASGGTSGGNASGGTSGSGAGGSGGERAVQCVGVTTYFPEFDRACAKAEDCIAVAHQTNCCGAELVTGISASEQARFDAAESTCKQQYPACGCAAFGVDVEDGTRVDFAWKDQVEVACDAGSCKAKYSGTSFECGTHRCTEQQYCVQSSGGPAGTPTSYGCNPTACTSCSCISMPDCTCSEASGHLTVTCQRA